MLLIAGAPITQVETALPHSQRLHSLVWIPPVVVASQRPNALPAGEDSACSELDAQLRPSWLLRKSAGPGEAWFTWIRDEGLHWRATVIAERDALATERDGLVAQRDGLSAERDALAAERDALQAKVSAQEDQLSRINQELDEILQLIDSTETAAAEPDPSEQVG